MFQGNFHIFYFDFAYTKCMLIHKYIPDIWFSIWELPTTLPEAIGSADTSETFWITDECCKFVVRAVSLAAWLGNGDTVAGWGSLIVKVHEVVSNSEKRKANKVL